MRLPEAIGKTILMDNILVYANIVIYRGLP
jgi:hypothetical protein